MSLLLASALLGSLAALASTGRTPGLDGPEGTLVSATTRFELHSDPWLNLHHLLYLESLRTDVGESSGLDARVAPEPWRRALSLYREELGPTPPSLVFDERLVELKRQVLARAWRGRSGEALELAMPVYRRLRWDEHDRRNRRWIETTSPALREIENEAAAALSRAFGGAWPSGRLRVDVVGYAGEDGAYTTNDPDHIVISSTRAGYQGDVGVEMILHEASHARSLEEPLKQAVARFFERRGAQAPPRLWHALIFYSSGELVRRHLGRTGSGQYTTYAEEQGYFERRSREGYRDAFERHWKPVLEGASDRDTALSELAATLSQAGDGPPRAAEAPP